MGAVLIAQQPLPALTESLVKELWQATRKIASAPADLLTTVVVAGDDLLHQLNKQYRSKDAPTDVLSFRYDEKTAEIFISTDRVRAQAIEYGVSEKAEAAFLVVHGLLHNEGWDHERSAEEADAMRQLEENILSLCNLPCARS